MSCVLACFAILCCSSCKTDHKNAEDTSSETEPLETDTALSIEKIEADWVTIPPGQFIYGSPENIPCRGVNVEEQVEVIITRPYKMASSEVTRKQWRITGLPDPSNNPPCDDCPQDYINWFDVLYWLNSLSRAAGLPECYELLDCEGIPSCGCLNNKEACLRTEEMPMPEVYACKGTSFHRYPARVDCPGYRLPTNAEWEWAARGGTTTVTYNGDIVVDSTSCLDEPVLNPIAWYCKDFENNPDYYKLHPVKQLLPNAYGLYDMLGNIREWVSDVDTGLGLRANEDKEPPLIDPIGWVNEDMPIRPMRGGGTGLPACNCTASNTFPELREMRRAFATGFRPVRTILD